ncbi:hypothetical protein Q604_UNBC14364G0001, partial [human gut metagenome]
GEYSFKAEAQEINEARNEEIFEENK